MVDCDEFSGIGTTAGTTNTSEVSYVFINIPLNVVEKKKVIELENYLGLRGESARLAAVKVHFLGDY